MKEPPKTRRRWVRFRLRTVFVVMTMAAVVAAWWGWNIRLVRQRSLLLDSLSHRGIATGFEYGWGGYTKFMGYAIPCDAAAVRWKLFGRNWYYVIEIVDGTFSDDDVRQLHALFPESDIWRVSTTPLANGEADRMDKL